MESLLIVVTAVSLVLAATMSVLAWALIRADRERAAARIEALEALAFEKPAEEQPHWDLALGAAPAPTSSPDRLDRQGLVNHDLFEPPSSGSSAAKRWLAVAAVGLVILAGYLVATAMRSHESGWTASMAAEPRQGGASLELISLRHSVADDGVFVVAGLVQNPAAGRPLTRLEAVVYLFDAHEQYLKAGRAPLDATVISPGSDAAFEVRVAGVSGISRYRVGFREADGATVAHVDLRGSVPADGLGDPMDPPDTVHRIGSLRAPAEEGDR
jgi:hypothetical protein